MRKKWAMALVLVFMLAGMGFLLYPTVSNWLNQINGSQAIQSLTEYLADMDEEEMERQRQLAQEYNRKVSAMTLTGSDVWGSTLRADDEYYEILNYANHIMGYMEIPKIEVRLPIYHGVSAEVLSKGVGHVPQTAFPIGGEGNHSVLTGHTGLPSAQLFTDLIELEEGDRFYIYILEEVLTYEIDQIRVVLPEEVDLLLPVAGEDYCTLVTCTPYGVNSHRLLVRGHRAQTIETEENEVTADTGSTVNTGQAVLYGGILLLFLVGMILLYFYIRKKQGGKRGEQDEEMDLFSMDYHDMDV